MIYLTGDCHGDFSRFTEENFPEQKEMTKNDYMIICGDFGGIFAGRETEKEREDLNFLESRPFTTLFLDGNHENFDRLDAFPKERWKGGQIHRIRPSILHLLRGEIFRLEGKNFFVFGGAKTHDTEGGILSAEDPSLEEKIKILREEGKPFRIRHVNWWERELPCEAEMENAKKNLTRHNYRVDYILTHCCAADLQKKLGGGLFKEDRASLFLQEIKDRTAFRFWFFGHYHADGRVSGKEILVYRKILRIR